MAQVSFRDTELALIISSQGLRQSAFGVPIPQADLDYMVPWTTKQSTQLNENVDTLRDCTTEFVIAERVTSRFNRLSIAADARGNLMGIAAAYTMGAAGVSGSQANETQSLLLEGASGTYTLSLQLEGITYTTSTLAWDATGAQVMTALNAMLQPSFGPNCVTVGGPGTSKTVTFQNGLASTNLPLLEVDASLLSSGSITIEAGTDGSQYAHPITLASGYTLPFWSALLGFRNSSIKPKRYYDIVGDSLEISGQAGGNVTMSVNTAGNGQTPRLLSYSYPDCDDSFGLRTADVRVKIGSTWYSRDIRSFSVSITNNLLLGDDPFTLDSIDIQRIERASERAVPTVTLDILGEEGDALYESAAARTISAVSVYIGPPNNRLQVDLPAAQLTLASPQLAFDGEARRSVIKLEAKGMKVSGNSLTPVSCTAFIDQATALLSTP